MSCTDLQPHFDAAPRPRNIAELVDTHSPDCGCESGKVSAFSDGQPISDDEHLLRIVLAPRDCGDVSLPQFEDAFILPMIGTGLSMLRESRATADEIVRLANELVDHAADALPPSEVAEVVGIVRFQARLARERSIPADSTENTGRRTICVYATPDQQYPSHADLLLAFNRFSSGGKRRKEAFGFTARLEKDCFIKAADFTRADITGIRLAGRKTA